METEQHTLGGSLTVMGTGIEVITHMTIGARALIEQADKVFYLVNNPIAAHWITGHCRDAESLYSCYQDGQPRLTSYFEMVERMLSEVRKGKKVCAVFYGHPGVFVFPSHEAIKQARLEGFRARMIPAISAEDCLFADLGIDPARYGCQSFEATDFLLYKRKFDVNSSLILWQIGAIGDTTFQMEKYNLHGLPILIDYLCQYYPPTHEAIIYEAPEYAILDAEIKRMPIANITEDQVSPISTLYIPPKELARPDKDMLKRLGLEPNVHMLSPKGEPRELLKAARNGS